MKSYRIGVDRLIAWHIVSDGVPYNLAEKNLTFKVSHPRGGFTVPSDGFTISGNVILWTFYGKDQKLLGPYSLTLIENEGQENMLTFDACNAFAFVSCTCQEGGIENPDLQLSGIDVETDLATIGIKLVVPVIGDNGNWFIGGVDTGHPVGGGSDCDCEQPDMFASSGEPGHIKNNIIRFHPSSSVTTVDVGALDEGDVIVAGVPYALWVRLGGNLMSPSRLGTSAVALKGINGPGIMVQFIGDGSGTCSLLKASPNYGVENYMTVTIGHVDTIPTTLLDDSVILRPELTEALSDKQNQIADLETIRSNAASAITQLQTILGPDATDAIDRFNEIISFLEGIEEGDEGKLAAIIASIEQQIAKCLPLAGGVMEAGSGLFNGADPERSDYAVGFNTDHNAFGSRYFPTFIRSSVDPKVRFPSADYVVVHAGNIGNYILFKASPTTLNSSHNLNDYEKGYYGYSNANNPGNSYGDNTALLCFASARGVDRWQIAFNGNGINSKFGPDVAIRGYYSAAWSEWFRFATIESNVKRSQGLAHKNGTEGASVNEDGSVTFAGEVFAPSFQESSDETLKDFGEDIKIDFDKLKALPKKYFTWKSGGEKQIGTSAQEVQKLFPEIVGKREDGTLTMDYGKLSMVALKAVDELYEKNKALEKRILKLEALILK